jgi:dUTP pyrophosphatase
LIQQRVTKQFIKNKWQFKTATNSQNVWCINTNNRINKLRKKLVTYKNKIRSEYMNIELINEKCKPKRSYTTDSGIDCYLNIDKVIEVKPNQTKVLPLGFKMEIPQGYGGIVKARSSIFKDDINIDGLIDSDYRGEVCVMVQNNGKENYILAPRQRICQIVIVKIDGKPLNFVNSLSETERGTGGFGSTN